MELGITDRNTEDYLAGIVSKLHPDADPAFAKVPDESQRERLSRLMLVHDWQLITGTLSATSEGSMSTVDIVGVTRGSSDTEHSPPIHILTDLAVLIRTGSVEAMDADSQAKVLSYASSRLPGFIRDGTDSLARELDVMMTPDKESNPSDWVAPNALYGLFMLSDAKTIREYLSKTNR
ncbi:MAG TPA: hypothetical protein VN420_00700 [Candidatus Fimivivens sp.]|nr:hypothetical protein [Candidatus Fimivivens sp.]